MIMGFAKEAGPNLASVYHCPFRETIIEGGDDFETGHSNIFYRARTKWIINPLDKFDGTATDPNNIEEVDDQSQYLVECAVNFNFTLIN
jgi:hypothetical protein